ncbi:hypothetical protein AK830_g948 [Neonectria ditissima]|uniref:Uncharacterized protein n=1 Tax=Neonectria ditissima TaxID=78410 RepID=A0A0P7BFV9_9HYPO|nr:hypothetical protein AK830_g948 [Neonectria ditissima]
MSGFQLRLLDLLPITYQSQDVSLSEWISLLTLCLAPLIAHIVVGTPAVSYLCNSRPQWHEEMCHYNPTSILWRYAAITDRRIRSRSWNRIDLAATNAIFWTTRGWDGSEAMVKYSLPYCVHLPDHARISVFSREMIKTIIVTLQGIQAVIVLVGTFVGNKSTVFTKWMAVDIIFFPLASIGLLRLCCGLWLNDDFLYSTHHNITSDHHLTNVDRVSSTDSLLEAPLLHQPSQFRETSFWLSRLFRTLFLLVIVSMLSLAILYLISGRQYTATDFVVILFYTVLFTATILIFLYYFVRGCTTTTVIPCIATTAYKAYTGIIFGLMLSALVVSCIETRRTPCGKYTSGPGAEADYLACRNSANDVIPLAADPDFVYYGIAAYNYTVSSNGTIVGIDHNRHQVFNFTGMCLGEKDKL